MDRPDGRLNAWILAWAGPTLFENPAGSSTRRPSIRSKDALAFSENLLLPAVVVAPLQRAFGPVLAYNVALLGSLLLSGLARAAPGAARERRPARGVRGGSVLRGRAAPLDAPVAPARAGHGVPAARAPGARPLLGAPHAAPRARRRADAGAPGPVVGVPRRDHGDGRGRGGARGALRRPAPARARAPRRSGCCWRPSCSGRSPRPTCACAPSRDRSSRSRPSRSTPPRCRPTSPRGPSSGGRSRSACSTPRRSATRCSRACACWRSESPGLASAPTRYRAVAVAASAVAVVFSLGPETAFYRFLHEHLVLVRGVRALARFALVPTLALSVLAGLALAGRRRLRRARGARR